VVVIPKYTSRFINLVGASRCLDIGEYLSVLYTAVLGTHYLRRQQKKSGQLVLFQAHRISMLIGYARVSTQDQTLDLQTDALTQAGCEKIFKDMTSGAKVERPGLQEAMNHLRAGDTLVVWRLDRLGCTLKQLIATITD
jgi:predicted site-specific integrase-resolvase